MRHPKRMDKCTGTFIAHCMRSTGNTLAAAQQVARQAHAPRAEIVARGGADSAFEEAGKACA